MAAPYVRAVSPRLRRVLLVVWVLVMVLGANSAYLASITFAEWVTGRTFQNYFYLWMFIGHLAVGLLLVVPFLIFAVFHVRAAWRRRNRRAVKVGYALLASAVVLLASGLLLTRFPGFTLTEPGARSAIYWVHAIMPIAAAWLYILHRLAGPRIKWRQGLVWAGGAAALIAIVTATHLQNPRPWNVAGPKEGDRYFLPSFARTTTGRFIPARTLMMDDYCKTCHADTHARWLQSAHRFSSFNNPLYLASVRETRKVAMERDGSVQASRWCAGCHDPVPFFSGRFDDPQFDDEKDPTAMAGLTCTACHAITNVNSTRGNGDFTIEEPSHYPFAFSTQPVLRFVNEQLVKAKPSLHKRTFLKPFHRTTEFCSVCHKVHIPNAVTNYKDFLRGQNHYDSFILSAASGGGARSFYYPDKGQRACSGCHMPLAPSADFGARVFEGSDRLSVHDHLFAAANTALPHLRDEPKTVSAIQSFLTGVARVDLFAVKKGRTIDGQLLAPLRPEVPALAPGETYLLEAVVRTLKLGHHLTQGTADSNEIWLEVTAKSGGRIIGGNGAIDSTGEVDPWAYFFNVFMLDRHGRRIDRRNVQDIFVPLYDHQVPPGAASVVHYELRIPAGLTTPVEVEARLQYRKFDRGFTRFALGADRPMDLPVTTIASDRVEFPAARGPETASTSPIPLWERWNDYGIALFLEGSVGSEKGELRQASEAFGQVERLGRPDGPLNLARVFYKEGRLDEAASALRRAAAAGAPPWTVGWLNGLVNKENGHLDEAIANFESVLNAASAEMQARGFDFSRDYEVINELGQTLFERAKMERDPSRADQRTSLLKRAAAAFERTLAVDSENVVAHYALGQIYGLLGDPDRSATHTALHARYKPDENARDRAVALARAANPAANYAAQSIVIYRLGAGSSEARVDGTR
jgi:tetratricopeptide (TPR) repeat protein